MLLIILLTGAVACQLRAAEPGADDPAPPVKLEKVIVAGQAATDATNAFADKAGSDTGQDVVSGPALSQPSNQNASDALKGVSGVTVVPGSDGSNSVSIRGLAPQYNRLTVDGQRQSAPGKFSAGSGLDSLPPEVLKSIEVSKSLTPDMDGDAIGGVINVSTADASALKKPLVEVKEQLTYDSMVAQTGTRSSVSAGTPFALWSKQPDSGLLAVFSYDDLYFRRENVENFDDWPLIGGIPAFTHTNVENSLDHRLRNAFLLNFDTHRGNLSWFLKSNVTSDARHRVRSQEDFDAAQGMPLALTPESGTFTGLTVQLHGIQQDITRSIATVSTGGKWDAGRLHVTTSLGYTRTEDKEPNTRDAMFSSIDPYILSYATQPNPFLPVLTLTDATNPAGSRTDPSGYALSNFTVSKGDAVDQNRAAQVDAQINLEDTPRPSFIKIGAKVQGFGRAVLQTRTVYGSSASYPPLTPEGLLHSPSVTFQNGGYTYGPVADPSLVDPLVIGNPGRFPIDVTDTALASAAGSTVQETIAAGYAMGRWVWNGWSAIAGIRYEATRFHAQASQPQFAADGSLLGFSEAQDSRSYTNALPGIHLQFDGLEGVIFRASVYDSLVRPAYGDLAPYLDLNFDQFRARVGNPDLKPYRATNSDFTVDWYRESFGLFSGGLFFKSIRDFQVDSERLITVGNLGQFVEYQKINGDAAQVAGVELSWKSSPFNWGDARISASANYTSSRSTSHVPGRPGEDIPLPMQARNQTSIGMNFGWRRWSGDLMATWHSRLLDAVVSPGRDWYEEPMWNLDANLSYQLARSWKFFAGGTNLTHAQSEGYSGIPSQLKEFGSRSIGASFGLNWKL